MRWLDSLEDPETAQGEVLWRLLDLYSETEYGGERVREVSSLEDYRRSFPAVSYAEVEGLIKEALSGRYRVLLSSPPVMVGVTSGTRGPPKLIPVTEEDLAVRRRVMLEGASALAEAVGVEPGPVLGPFVGGLGEAEFGGRRIPLVYASGLMAALAGRPLEAVERVGPGADRESWNERFDAILSTLERLGRVSFLVGSPLALYKMAERCLETRRVLPGELADVGVVLSVGMPDTRAAFRRPLEEAYSPRLVAEGYGATEGLFAMQPDAEPGLAPFYSEYLLEVEMGGEVKMLYEMRPGQWGELIVSTPTLPRYRVGDVVERLPSGRFSVPCRAGPPCSAMMWVRRVVRGIASLL
ncbi:MAG: hypothetical protein DRO06_02390 [Thermoproteota archaeon]|nr:MAG: hypothetical protein DRO06_02390 [Candidatus Korarchaeota archaeon]